MNWLLIPWVVVIWIKRKLLLDLNPLCEGQKSSNIWGIVTTLGEALKLNIPLKLSEQQHHRV
jgi:hypothetical protein